jgi:hypothetical protein
MKRTSSHQTLLSFGQNGLPKQPKASTQYGWTPECFYTSRSSKDEVVDNLPLLNSFNEASLADLGVGDTYMYCQGEKQIEREKRHDQMTKKTILEWRTVSLETKKPVQMRKYFNIVEIKKGTVPGIPDYFNGHLLVLKRIA